jgi:hypothetical protein
LADQPSQGGEATKAPGFLSSGSGRGPPTSGRHVRYQRPPCLPSGLHKAQHPTPVGPLRRPGDDRSSVRSVRRRRGTACLWPGETTSSARRAPLPSLVSPATLGWPSHARPHTPCRTYPRAALCRWPGASCQRFGGGLRQGAPHTRRAHPSDCVGAPPARQGLDLLLVRQGQKRSTWTAPKAGVADYAFGVHGTRRYRSPVAARSPNGCGLVAVSERPRRPGR